MRIIKTLIKFAIYMIVVIITLLSCSRVHRVHYDIPKTMLYYSECFNVVNPKYNVASFHTTEDDTIYVVKRSINDWARGHYRKLNKGDSVQITLVRNDKIDSRYLGVQSALKFKYSIDNHACHSFDFSSNGNIYDSPDLILTKDGVYLNVSKDLPTHNGGRVNEL